MFYDFVIVFPCVVCFQSKNAVVLLYICVVCFLFITRLGFLFASRGPFFVVFFCFCDFLPTSHKGQNTDTAKTQKKTKCRKKGQFFFC